MSLAPYDDGSFATGWPFQVRGSARGKALRGSADRRSSCAHGSADRRSSCGHGTFVLPPASAEQGAVLMGRPSGLSSFLGLSSGTLRAGGHPVRAISSQPLGQDAERLHHDRLMLPGGGTAPNHRAAPRELSDTSRAITLRTYVVPDRSHRLCPQSRLKPGQEVRLEKDQLAGPRWIIDIH